MGGLGGSFFEAGVDRNDCLEAVATEATSILEGTLKIGDRPHTLSCARSMHALTEASQTDCECGPTRHRRAATLGGRGKRTIFALSCSRPGAVVGLAPPRQHRERGAHAWRPSVTACRGCSRAIVRSQRRSARALWSIGQPGSMLGQAVLAWFGRGSPRVAVGGR
jgi:hypothetical protein